MQQHGKYYITLKGVHYEVSQEVHDAYYLDYINVNSIGELMKPNFVTQHFEILLAFPKNVQVFASGQ